MTGAFGGGRLAPVVNRLWQLCCWPGALSFSWHLDQLQQVQTDLLRLTLSRTAPTLYEQNHHLSGISTYQQFRERVPVATYGDLEPYLSVAQGILAQPAHTWEPTSGSSGASKWIPWTRGLQQQFGRGVSVWIWDLFRTYPGMRDGRSYWQLTPKTSLISAPSWLQGQQLGFASDGEYLGPWGRATERAVLVAPPLSQERFWETTIRSLIQAKDLRSLSCWSPSFLTLLQQKTLDLLGCWQPRAWWPKLQLISCWLHAASAPYRQNLEELFPGVALQAKGLLSTEALTTIPYQGRYPLAYQSHFFEFRDHRGEVFPSWELEFGQSYSVIQTTLGGLIRYDSGDRVLVTGFLGSVPCLEFLGRDGVSDHRGEKLSLALLEELLEPLEGFVMLAFEDDGYVLFCDSAVPLGQRQRQVQHLETELQKNYCYADARHLDQLRALRGFLIPERAELQWARIAEAHLGARPGSAKPQRFHPWIHWGRHFEGRFFTAQPP